MKVDVDVLEAVKTKTPTGAMVIIASISDGRGNPMFLIEYQKAGTMPGQTGLLDRAYASSRGGRPEPMDYRDSTDVVFDVPGGSLYLSVSDTRVRSEPTPTPALSEPEAPSTAEDDGANGFATAVPVDEGKLTEDIKASAPMEASTGKLIERAPVTEVPTSTAADAELPALPEAVSTVEGTPGKIRVIYGSPTIGKSAVKTAVALYGVRVVDTDDIILQVHPAWFTKEEWKTATPEDHAALARDVGAKCSAALDADPSALVMTNLFSEHFIAALGKYAPGGRIPFGIRRLDAREAFDISRERDRNMGGAPAPLSTWQKWLSPESLTTAKERVVDLVVIPKSSPPRFFADVAPMGQLFPEVPEEMWKNVGRKRRIIWWPTGTGPHLMIKTNSEVAGNEAAIIEGSLADYMRGYVTEGGDDPRPKFAYTEMENALTEEMSPLYWKSGDAPVYFVAHVKGDRLAFETTRRKPSGGKEIRPTLQEQE